MSSYALELTGIVKRFGHVTALDGASLAVAPGTVHALLGENGAGKTTLMRVAFGLTHPDAGSIAVDGVVRRFRSPAAAIRAGLAMVQQHFTLVPTMTVLENVALGRAFRRDFGTRVQRLAREAGVDVDLHALVATLGVADQQRVELLKALAQGARILILDEPTAALAPADASHLFAWLRGFRDRGGSAVIITHKLREALDIADGITVLRRGRPTWSGAAAAAQIGHLVSAMVGDSRGMPLDREGRTRAPLVSAREVARVDDLAVTDDRGATRVRGVTLRVHAGEILGVAAVEGSGARELMYALAGRLPPRAGHVMLPEPVGFVPEDRQRDALLLDESIADNVALRGAGARHGWQRRRAADAAAERLVREQGIGAGTVSAPAWTLSGGTQQRLVLARELAGPPPLVVAVNPTRGLDIAATSEVHRRMREAAAGGSAIVYHSADLDEVLEIADRVVVVFDGRLREVPRDREVVGRAMLGAA